MGIKKVRTKTVKEIIEFYYDWKKTHHYKQWKDSYKPDEKQSDIDDEGEEGNI